MSRIFYDNFLALKKLPKLINATSLSIDEKEELWKILDEIIHHRVMGCILDNLDEEHHQEFLEKFTSAPFDEELINYLESKSGKKIGEEIRKEILQVEKEILQDLK